MGNPSHGRKREMSRNSEKGLQSKNPANSKRRKKHVGEAPKRSASEGTKTEHTIHDSEGNIVAQFRVDGVVNSKCPMVRKADFDVKEKADVLEYLSNVLAELIPGVEGEFITGIADQLLGVRGWSPKEFDDAAGFALASFGELKPQTATEAMLASQMIAIHLATMKVSSQFAGADYIPQYQTYETALNKLARTFATQTEALRKLRSGGQQKMTVEHVHVHEGGQAIVGNVKGGGVDAAS